MSKYQTCAFAFPLLRPGLLEDGRTIYPVDRRCAYAQIWDGQKGILNTARCEDCAQYTDPTRHIVIRTGRFYADIYFDRLMDEPLPAIRKIFNLLLADPWSNEDAIRQMTLYLDAAVMESEAAWKQASTEYQNGWRYVPNKKSRLKDDRQKLRENDRLTAAVKRAKARY